MYIKNLSYKDLEDVDKLERETYPEDLCLGVEDFQEDFNNNSENNRCCLGAYSGGKMVGYIIAYLKRDNKYSLKTLRSYNRKYYISDLVCKNRATLLPLLLKFLHKCAGYMIEAELRNTSKRMIEGIQVKYPGILEDVRFEEMPNYYGEESAYKFTARLTYSSTFDSSNIRNAVMSLIYNSDVPNLKSLLTTLCGRFSAEEIISNKKFILRQAYKKAVSFYAQIGDNISFVVCDRVPAFRNRPNSIGKFADKIIESDIGLTEIEDDLLSRVIMEKTDKLEKLHKKYVRFHESFGWHYHKTLDNAKFNDGSLAYYRRLLNKVLWQYEKKNCKFVERIYIADKDGYYLFSIGDKDNLVPYINSLSFDIVMKSMEIEKSIIERLREVSDGHLSYVETHRFYKLRKVLKKEKFDLLMNRLEERISSRRKSLESDENVRNAGNSAVHDYLYPMYEIMDQMHYLTATALFILLDKDYEDLLKIKDSLNILSNGNVRRMRVKNLRKEISTAIRKGESISKVCNDISVRADTNFFKNKKIGKVLMSKMEEFLIRVRRYAPKVSASYLFSCFGDTTKTIIEGNYEGLFEESHFHYKAIEVAELVKKCLGNRGKGALVENPGGLFTSLSKIQNVQDIIAGNIEPKNIPAILSEIKQRHVDVPGEYMNLGFISAKVEPKCSPEFLTAGDASVCCMSFGQQKAIDYAIQKGFGIFNVYYKDRVVANSLIWINDLYNCLVLDNIEVAPNYVHLNPYIKNLYWQFIDETIEKYKLDFAVQGYSHNDLELYDDKVRRCSIWGQEADKEAPISYIPEFMIKPREVNLSHFYSDANRCYVVKTTNNLLVAEVSVFIKTKNVAYK